MLATSYETHLKIKINFLAKKNMTDVGVYHGYKDVVLAH